MERIPAHIAIMMDGNGRWGKRRGLTRSQGHYAGSKAMERIIDASLELGIKVLTLYAFSTENWKRPKDEVNYLMDLPARYLTEKLPEFMEKDIKVWISGNIEGLPSHTRNAVETAMRKTSNNRALVVNFALNYGGRNELIHAAKSLIQDINISKISTNDISKEMIENYLYTKGLPDPEILIRTGGEKRLSNFLLWQSSSAEMWFTDTLFPDFNKELLLQAINDVSKRKVEA
ncbi:isoprenyl transferase [Sutcliffiella cohnii]|uniref:Isoprenyl transferase n=1 Tax=Sutcliffiella cohnii TaxID=33932 RepID=A0A223KR74_9BACI|nr:MULTISPECIES: isoprenyl transferase [Sutcliffiella]AST91887.1 di-trans,poly-cis-decaprenylcistransferase [Sutcliffiella cohnii]MED4015155.1 isoprenyl transferase [Sutcliffiella cohnii]WBL13115.1 isoprenyl transferase [Sutcliffiella sp. NC1]